MVESQGQIARRVVAASAPYAFSRACAAAVGPTADFTILERMLPGVKFATTKVSPTEWELTGVCEDGSQVVWRVG